jgi:hypothetical protein
MGQDVGATARQSRAVEWARRAADFTEIAGITGTAEDRHTIGWRSLVADYSLIMRATA